MKSQLESFSRYSEPTRYFKEDKALPFLYVGNQKPANPEERVQVLLCQVDVEKISTDRPSIDQCKLKRKEDWLMTGLGSLRNVGNVCKIVTVENGQVEVVRTVTGWEKKSPNMNPGEFALRTVYWQFSNDKYKDFCCTTSTIMKDNGEELSLGFIDYFTHDVQSALRSTSGLEGHIIQQHRP